MSAYVYMYLGVCVERLSISEYVYSIMLVNMSTILYECICLPLYISECVYVYAGVCLERLSVREYVYSVISVNVWEYV